MGTNELLINEQNRYVHKIWRAYDVKTRFQLHQQYYSHCNKSYSYATNFLNLGCAIVGLLSVFNILKTNSTTLIIIFIITFLSSILNIIHDWQKNVLETEKMEKLYAALFLKHDDVWRKHEKKFKDLQHLHGAIDDKDLAKKYTNAINLYDKDSKEADLDDLGVSFFKEGTPKLFSRIRLKGSIALHKYAARDYSDIYLPLTTREKLFQFLSVIFWEICRWHREEST